MSSALRRLSDDLVDLVAAVTPSAVTIRGFSTDLLHGGSGSGWLYDSIGHIVTNAHVVAGMTRNLRVQFRGLPELPAAIVGLDAATDLAVIRVHAVPAGRIPLVVREAPARLGELCLAVGSPLDFRESVSLGIVSGTARQIDTGGGRLEEILQTDAAINPGNSGGPLVDAAGQIIGVNVAKSSRADGIGFAVPAEIVADIVPELIAHGAVARGTLGISIAETWSPDGATQTVITVQKVATSGSPFAVNDVIVTIDDYPVTRRYDVRKMLGRASIGRDLLIRVRRADSEISFAVRSQNVPD
ncbi:MAG: hypothetical protein RLZZ297_205 [Chloroflexota bacterium]|jgi:S1-C subfamily serine protease